VNEEAIVRVGLGRSTTGKKIKINMTLLLQHEGMACIKHVAFIDEANKIRL